MRDTLPRGSVIALIICAILAVWSTYEVTMNDENLRFKGVAEDCEYDTLDGYIDSEGTPCFDEMNIWNNVWDRTIRGWLFAGLIGAIAIVRIKPEVKDLGEEE